MHNELVMDIKTNRYIFKQMSMGRAWLGHMVSAIESSQTISFVMADPSAGMWPIRG